MLSLQSKFLKFIREKAEAFKKEHINSSSVIRVVSHLDADGLTAASIIAKALMRENKKYALSVVHQMNSEFIKELANEKYDYYIFADIGSSHLNELSRTLGEKFLVLDHHEIEENFQKNKNLVNPHCFNIDGGTHISGAGTAYLFCRALNEENKDSAHLAIIGALGDAQECDGFSELNSDILNDAIKSGYMEVKKGLKFFGAYSKPIHKVLEYNTDPFIPGITGSESNAIKFLKDLGIELKHLDNWRKISDLNKDEMSRLISAIILKRAEEKNPENIIGNIYILKKEPEKSNLRDAREFCTMLNACGRMGKASLGIGASMGYSKMRQMAINCMEDYRKEIVGALNKFYNKEFDVIKENTSVIINVKDNLRPTMVGTLASMISKVDNNYKYVLSLARMDSGDTKASLRFAGNSDVRIILKEILNDVGDFGGHKNAAGAVFPTEYEEKFIERAQTILRKLSMEESISM